MVSFLGIQAFLLAAVADRSPLSTNAAPASPEIETPAPSIKKSFFQNDFNVTTEQSLINPLLFATKTSIPFVADLPSPAKTPTNEAAPSNHHLLDDMAISFLGQNWTMPLTMDTKASLEQFQRFTENHLRNLLQHSSLRFFFSDLKNFLFAQEETIPMKQKPTMFDWWIDLIDPKYNEYAILESIDPCVLHRYHLGFPYGLLAERFWASAHVPHCIPADVSTCASFSTSPIQFVNEIVTAASEKDTQKNHISRMDLDDAIALWIKDEAAEIQASIYSCWKDLCEAAVKCSLLFSLVCLALLLAAKSVGSVSYSLGRSSDANSDEFSPYPIAALNDIPAAARSVDSKTSIKECHRFFKEEAPKQLHPALHQKSSVLQRSASQRSLKEEASEQPVLHTESSLQRTAGIYLNGAFMPFAEPNASTTTDKDREHLGRLIQREINKIRVYKDDGVFMPFRETDAPAIMDQDPAHLDFPLDHEAKRVSTDSNHKVWGFDESIYTTVLDLSTIPIEVQQRAEEITNAMENKSFE